jgi:acylglycerol lipase
MLRPGRTTLTGVPATIDRATARDGTSILVRHWAPASGPAWANVLLVHGLAEHSGRYEHVGDHLAAAGLDVHGMDLRGFGGSGGRRAWVARWSELHDDVEERITAIRSASELPVVLYGHSLGGLVALGYVLDGRTAPDLLVLSAPAISAVIPAWKRLLVRGLARVVPTATVANGLDVDHLSSDPAVCEDYRSDPLNVHRSTVGFGVLAFAEQDRVSAALDRLSVPTLVIHGGDDRIVPPPVSKPFEGRPGVKRKVYPGVRHELHNEPATAAGVLDDVVGWLREHVVRR